MAPGQLVANAAAFSASNHILTRTLEKISTYWAAPKDIVYNILAIAAAAAATKPSTSAAMAFQVPSADNASAIFASYMSYSIEFCFWPDFAGNLSSPNTFSDNLLVNLGELQGKRPDLRIGGNTQDYALWDESLPYAVNGTYDFDRSLDYPTTVYIGPSYFESYQTFNDTKFTHGFNLGLGANETEGWDTLAATAPLVCRAIGQDNIGHWEYGNEPDLYPTSAQGPKRPMSWTAQDYAEEWLNGTRFIRDLVEEACPDMVSGGRLSFSAPSNAGVFNFLRAEDQWGAGLDNDSNIDYFSTHNYISGAESPGVTLQGTLMNHEETVASADDHARTYRNLTELYGAMPPHVLGEHNSLYNQGKPGLSNSFGAALWGLDFNLYAASIGIKRVHMHMGTNYRYASWQPVDTNDTVKGTKAPYYGNIALAAMVSPAVHPSSSLASTVFSNAEVSIAHVDLSDPRAAAYAAYLDGNFARLAVINLEAHNSTLGGTGEAPDPEEPERPSFTYAFEVPVEKGWAEVQRLYANGSDAISGITWDGWSYNYELDEGRPVKMDNVTTGERVVVEGGVVKVEVLASQAVLLNFVEV